MNKYIKNYISKLNTAKIEKIDHEEALSSTIYKIILDDNSIVILKAFFSKERWKRESYFLNKLKNAIKIPKIIDLLQPTEKFSGAILMEYIPGELLSSLKLTDNLAFQMGVTLAKLHKIPCKYYGDIANKQQTNPFDLIIENYKESIRECEQILEKEFLEKISSFFFSEIKKVKGLDGPCVVHRDYKPGNIIIENNEIKAVIDFENTKHSFAEEDFAQMQYLVWEKNDKSKIPFLEGYKTIRPLPDLNSIMYILRVWKSLATIGFTIARNTYNSSNKIIFEKNLSYLKRVL